MGLTDGTVLGTTKILDNGDPASRWNLVLVAEGYRNSEMNLFQTHAQTFVNTLLSTPPFDDMEAAINVYRIDVASTDSGADDPLACGGSGATAATYFDASYCNGGIRRLLVVNSANVISTVEATVPQWHQIIVLVNSTVWGGSGGSIAVMCVAPGWETGALHELGHAAFGLADEYEYWAGCAVDTGNAQYTGPEPSAANVTANTDRATIKWGDLVLATTPLPTLENPNCPQCNYSPSTVPAGTVGAFEGAYYHHCDIFRPEFDCMMRNLNPFCAVCRRRITQVLEPFMPQGVQPDWVFDFDRYREMEFLPRYILEKWMLVAYLIINWRIDTLRDKLRAKPDREFAEVVAKHTSAYIRDGVLPPKDIQSAIINMADDMMGRKKVIIRAGDYIAIQNHIRAMKRRKQPVR